MGAGLGGLHPGRRGPALRPVDHGQEVDHAAAVDRVVQQVRARPHPELQRAGVGQARQPLGRDQAAEPRRARVDGLVAAGHPVPGDRVHAVGADHDRGFEHGPGRTAHPHARAGLFQVLDAAAEVQVLRPQGAGQQPLQGHPVQAVERRAERLAIPAVVPAGRDRAAVAAVAVDEPGGFGRHPGQVFAQAQVPEHRGSRWRPGRPPRRPHAVRRTARARRRRCRAAAAGAPA